MLRVALEAFLNEVVRCVGEPRFCELPAVHADKLVLHIVPALEKGDHACAETAEGAYFQDGGVVGEVFQGVVEAVNVAPGEHARDSHGQFCHLVGPAVVVEWAAEGLPSGHPVECGPGGVPYQVPEPLHSPGSRRRT